MLNDDKDGLIFFSFQISIVEQKKTSDMGRNISADTDDKIKDKSTTKQSDSDSNSDLDEEEFIVEKILKMRTTKKGKVLCRIIHSIRNIYRKNIHFCSDLLKWKGFSDSENTWVR